MASRRAVLVTGGAGYIGSHVVAQLQSKGLRVVVVDDFSTGLEKRLNLPAVRLNLADRGTQDSLVQLMRERGVYGIIHLAGKKRVDESIDHPLSYWQENVGGLMNLLQAAAKAAVERLVFSSSAAVYGAADVPRVSESTETNPINPYGETKLAGEWLLGANSSASSMRSVSLRYFNVVGCSDAALGDTFVHNLFGQSFYRLSQGITPAIYGADYATPDGTCVRDYIHVNDLASAHVAALESLGQPKPLLQAYNLGTGRGYSVREVMEQVGRHIGEGFSPRIEPRRAGDPPFVVADPSAAKRDFAWSAVHDLEDMVSSAWQSWHSNTAHQVQSDGRR